MLSDCNSVVSNATASDQLRKSIEARSLFPASVVHNAVMENASLTLVDKVYELSVTMCRQVCDSVLEEVERGKFGQGYFRTVNFSTS